MFLNMRSCMHMSVDVSYVYIYTVVYGASLPGATSLKPGLKPSCTHELMNS